MSGKKRRPASESAGEPANVTTVPWQRLPRPGGARAATIAADAMGGVYAATAAGLYASADEGDSWKLVSEAGASVLISPAGEAFVAHGGTLVRAGDARPSGSGVPPIEPLPPADGMDTCTLTALAMDSTGTLWAGVESAGLSFYPGTDDGESPPIYESANIVACQVRRSADGGATWTTEKDDIGAVAFASDARGRMWVAGTSGVHVVDESGWRRVFERPATCLAVGGDWVVVGTSMGAWLSQDAGRSLQPIAARYRERGPWGSMEGEAHDFLVLARAPDGAFWAGVANDGVFRLAPGGGRWDSLNFGLTLEPRVGSRPGQVRPTSLAFTPAGTALAATEQHGLFRRRDVVGAS